MEYRLKTFIYHFINLTVYKYYNFENTFSLSNLENSIIYFALASEWKKENEIEFIYKMNSQEQIFYCLLMEAKNLEKKDKKQYDFNKKNHTLQLENPFRNYKIEELMLYSAKSFLQNKVKNEASFRDKLLNGVRLFSTCKTVCNRNNWLEFAKDSTGFCVGYRRESIIQREYEVIYTNELPIVDIISSQNINENSYHPLYRLPKKYEDEQEIRFLKVIDGKKRKHEDEFNVVLSPTDIVSITAGINIEQESLEKLKAIAQIHYPHIQVKVGIY